MARNDYTDTVEGADLQREGVSSQRESLRELFADYRIDKIQQILSNIPREQWTSAERYYHARYLWSASRLDEITWSRGDWEADQSPYGDLSRVVLRFADGETDSAIRMARQAVSRYNSVAAHELLSMVLSDAGESYRADYLRATTDFLQVFPDDLSAHANYGNALKTQSHQSAISFLRRAVERFPHSAVLRNYLGHSLAALERFDEAMVQYDTAIGLAPDYGNLYYMRGNIAWRLGDYFTYEQDIIMAGDLSPNKMNWYARAVVNLRRGEMDKAMMDVELLRAACSCQPTLALQAVALAMQGEFDRSASVANELSDPQWSESVRRFNDAQRDLANGRLQSAVDQWIACYNRDFFPAVTGRWIGDYAGDFELLRISRDTSVHVGSRQVGIAPRNQVFRVRDRRDRWLFGEFTNQENTVRGWIRSEDTVPVAAW